MLIKAEEAAATLVSSAALNYVENFEVCLNCSSCFQIFFSFSIKSCPFLRQGGNLKLLSMEQLLAADKLNPCAGLAVVATVCPWREPNRRGPGKTTESKLV